MDATKKKSEWRIYGTISATILAVVGLSLNVFFLEKKTDNNSEIIYAQEHKLMSLSQSLDAKEKSIVLLNQQLKDKMKTLGKITNELKSIKVKFNSQGNELASANQQLEAFKNTIDTSLTASELIYKILKTIKLYGFRVTKDELSKALLKDYISYFSNEDKRKTQLLHREFEKFDSDKNNSLNNTEVALGVFK
jgi:septal ring factor EnvC (AmiA/AmiB activator)